MSVIENVLQLMQDQIKKYGLELLQRYPNDLLVHDRRSLEKYGKPGASIAWLAGHSHSHLVVLGLHKSENETVSYLTNMSSDDRFYLLKAHKTTGEFSIKEIEREAFARLATTPVPYERKGTVSDFWLHRGSERVGHIALEAQGVFQERTVTATVTPMQGISEMDIAALEMWCMKSVVEYVHTLFVSYEVKWNEPLKQAA